MFRPSLAKAFAAASQAPDVESFERARKKTASWRQVIENLITGRVQYGSRTPVNQTPAWATLEVVTGGFATGELVAAGPLLEHELSILRRIGPVPSGEERAALNAYFLSDAGLAELQELLQSRRYTITAPEEGALLTAAWLVQAGHAEQARVLVQQIAPFFSRLRFYPVPGAQPLVLRPVVHIQDAPAAVAQLRAIRPQSGVQAQKEAVEVWGPFYDRMAALFMETVRDGWPCQTYPQGWAERGHALLDEFAQIRRAHPLCGKPENPRKHFAQLRRLLEQALSTPRSLTGRDVARIRTILKGLEDKRGAPGSDQSTKYREAQVRDVSQPMHHRLAEVLALRTLSYAEGLSADEIARVVGPLTDDEASRHGMPPDTPIPASLRRKVRRCLLDTVEELARQGIIASGEVLARVLPQVTSGIRAQSVGDEQLGPLYAHVYRAFRRRRSLLLLNLQKQVQIEELPWVAAIEGFRAQGHHEQDVSRQALVQISATALRTWPYAILPNKLLQELGALAHSAGADAPFVEELAADIFMGQFSTTFVEAALLSAELMKGSLYAVYYGIDYPAIVQGIGSLRAGDAKARPAAMQAFAELCSFRAGALPHSSTAGNGMIIEQQQIVTTQNLAAVLSIPGFRSIVDAELFPMAQECFRWICRRQQMKIQDFHARLVMLKNTAYAWRQMVFFLSLQPERVPDFLQWSAEHLQEQSEPFRIQFQPAISGLELATAGHTPPREASTPSAARQFLGWSSTRHWLMPPGLRT